jgi:hypothetical protein
MPNALDTFRAQREAADHVYGRLQEITDLLARLQGQVDAVTADAELRALLRQEQSWLERLQAAITDVRRFREQERQRFWPGVWRRWVLAVGFALAAAAAAGAGYGWGTRPYAAELAELRSRVQLADAIVRRTMTMSAAERRQFDTLMQWNAPVRK